MCNAGLAHEAASAKSIAPSQLHPPKNLHGGLRCAMRGWLLKVRSKLCLCAKPATPPTPHPPLRKINCTFTNCSRRKIRLKICMVGCDVICGVLHAFQLRYFSTATQLRFALRLRHSAPPFAPRLQLRVRSTAKSIAPCRMHVQKKLHGGLRGEKRGWHLKPHPRHTRIK